MTTRDAAGKILGEQFAERIARTLVGSIAVMFPDVAGEIGDTR